MKNHYRLSLDKREHLHLFDVVRIAAKRRNLSLLSYVFDALAVLVSHDAQTDRVVHTALNYPKRRDGHPTELSKLRDARRKKQRARWFKSQYQPSHTYAERHPLRPVRAEGIIKKILDNPPSPCLPVSEQKGE